MLVDTHCHLSSKRFRFDWKNVVERARNEGVRKIIIPTINLTDARKAVELAEEEDCLCVAAGVYPGKCKNKENWKEILNELKDLVVSEDKVVAIGEIGLDLYWNQRNLEFEKKIFKDQMELAVELELPVVIHNRKAEDEIKGVMQSMNKLPEGQFHCWSGNEEFLEYVLKEGYYVGFCGNVSYPSSEGLRRLAKKAPIERTLVETDSPYLPPQIKRGKRNEPKNVKITAEFLSRLKKVELESFADQTTENAERLYKIA